jgi:hypothetical protein
MKLIVFQGADIMGSLACGSGGFTGSMDGAKVNLGNAVAAIPQSQGKNGKIHIQARGVDAKS